MTRWKILTAWRYGDNVTLDDTGVVVEAEHRADALVRAAEMGTFAGLGTKPAYRGAVAVEWEGWW